MKNILDSGFWILVMFEITLPIVGRSVNFFGLGLLGLGVGFLTGFFGVGGGFLVTPMLNIFFGIPYNFAVGSGLAQMVASSATATLRHRGMRNIDYRLGAMMVCSATAGVEVGARILEFLEREGGMTINGREIPKMNVYIGLIYFVMLTAIGTLVLLECLKTGGRPRTEHSVPGLAKRIHTIHLRPMLALPRSGVEAISVWVVLAMSLCTGILSGLLGVGGGFIQMPALIYLIGVPTLIAIGTSLFGIFCATVFGATSHAFKGNVDPVLVALLLCSVPGAYIGAGITKRIRAARIRFWFACLIYVAALLIALKFLDQIGYIGLSVD